MVDPTFPTEYPRFPVTDETMQCLQNAIGRIGVVDGEYARFLNSFSLRDYLATFTDPRPYGSADVIEALIARVRELEGEGERKHR